MDRSLKKLSRVELLELMVGLSEDCEHLIAENERLRKALSSKRGNASASSPKLSRSAKVGSIAEAALQANGYFEAAQKSADEYLREIKHLRDELSARANNAGKAAAAAAQMQADQRTQAILQDAQARARQIVERANMQADSILAQAQAQSEEALANANRQSHVIVAQASQQAAATQESLRSSMSQSIPRMVSPSDIPSVGLSQRQGSRSYSSSAQATIAYDNPVGYGRQSASNPGPAYGQADAGYTPSRSYVSAAPAYVGGTSNTAPSSADATAMFPRYEANTQRRGN